MKLTYHVYPQRLHFRCLPILLLANPQTAMETVLPTADIFFTPIDPQEGQEGKLMLGIWGKGVSFFASTFFSADVEVDSCTFFAFFMG